MWGLVVMWVVWGGNLVYSQTLLWVLPLLMVVCGRKAMYALYIIIVGILLVN